jgi:putative membrane protein
MIISDTPRMTQIAREVWKPLLFLFLWVVVVTVTYYVLPFKAPGLPLTLFGSALALFLGFRSNSAYQRWWEGRGLWGQMINASRSLARAAKAYLSHPQAEQIRREIIFRQIAYVHALRCQLRRQPMDETVERYLPDGPAQKSLQRTNVANGVIEGMGMRVEQARAHGWIDTIQQASLERVMVDISNAQGGMERLKNTPLPNQYRFFPMLFTHLFCIFLPIGLVETLGYATPFGSTVAGLMFLAVLAVGDDLVDPFANEVHDLPLCAMCRTIEIDLLQALGEPAPEPLEPDHRNILW